jgi:cation diffusion facilitator family transporter
LGNFSVVDSSVIKDKQHTAWVSLLASLAMTLLKLLMALLTGSLAILSDALHNAVDVLATIITLIAVRISDRPADQTHNYGHGKVENLSAFAESIILALTALWILWRAIADFAKPQTLQLFPTIIAIGVLCLAIGVDILRTLQLVRSAKKYGSEALRASSVHFRMDLISAGIVLIALLVSLLSHGRLAWMDNVGALVVALLMIVASVRLALHSIDVLVDRAPDGVDQQLQEIIRRVPGVMDVPRIRVRQGGNRRFVDTTIRVNPAATMEEGHRIATSVELAASNEHPSIDITVHVEPGDAELSLAAVVRGLAEAMHLAVHAVHAHSINERVYLSFHVEFGADITVSDAHAKVTELEKRIRLRMPQVAEIASHIEPVSAGGG